MGHPTLGVCHPPEERLLIRMARSNLAAMNWRRGILLAAINLVVAIPLILWCESRDATYVRNNYVSPKVVEAPTHVPSLPPDPKDEGVSFNLCNITDEFDWPERVVIFANEPDFLIIGWRRFCPAPWQFGGMLHKSGLQAPTPSSMVVQQKVDWGLLVLIPPQWFLVGAFPLIQPKKPWAEPGMLITASSVFSAAMFFITRPLSGSLLLLASLGQLPAACAGLIWLWWFGLLVWKLARAVWKRMTSRNWRQDGSA